MSRAAIYVRRPNRREAAHEEARLRYVASRLGHQVVVAFVEPGRPGPSLQLLLDAAAHRGFDVLLTEKRSRLGVKADADMIVRVLGVHRVDVEYASDPEVWDAVVEARTAARALRHRRTAWARILEEDDDGR